METKAPDIDSLFRFGKEVVLAAGEEAQNYFGKGEQLVKFDQRLVTEAEIHVEDFFHHRLAESFPEHDIFRSNHKAAGYTHEEKRYLWIFDPLDGVANFQAGIPIWGLSLALVENFWPIFGIFYMPATGDLFHARAGHQAFHRNKEIRVSPQESLNNESLLFTYSRFHLHYRSTFPGKIRNLGCAAAHACYVAMGRAEGAVLVKESYQGLAAASIIIEAAGGKLFRMDGGQFDLSQYLSGEVVDEHLLATAPALFPQFRDYLSRAV